MKRNENKVPEFDEIIFKNRNKTYGAFDIRKHYKSATSFSILGGVAIFTMLILGFTLTDKEGTASTGPKTVILVMSDPVLPEIVKPAEMKPPPELAKVIKYLEPVVTTDTTQISTFLPSTEEVIKTTRDGDINDTVRFVETTDPVIPSENKVFIVVKEMPEFPGGNSALLKFIGENLIYPVEAQNNNISGRVTLKFVVNPDGSVGRIEVLKSIDPLLDNEAIRVVKTLPKFKPGKQGGVPVSVWFMLPVVFKLENN